MIEAGSFPEPRLPNGMQYDRSLPQHLAHRGYWYVILEDGTRTVWQGENPPMECHVCHADPAKMPDCPACSGRGWLDHIPFADEPWSEVFPNLWVGGHDCQRGLDCTLADKDLFDVVISLHQERDPAYQPPFGVDNYVHRMADAELDPDHHTAIDELADKALRAILDGRRVLIRCHAGLNRSALVAALVLIEMGSSAEAAIDHIRSKRSPFALCNSSFVRYLHEKANNR